MNVYCTVLYIRTGLCSVHTLFLCRMRKEDGHDHECSMHSSEIMVQSEDMTVTEVLLMTKSEE